MSYGSFAEFYDLLTEDVDYPSRAQYLHGLFCRTSAAKGGILLDLACGTGTLSVELAKLGYDVIGVDSSGEMLSIAQQKVSHSGLQNIMLLNQDMCSLDLYGTVDFAVCMLDSINHLENLSCVKAAFSKISLFMNTGGVFIFDVNTVYKHREILGHNTFVYDLDTLYCVWRNQLDETDDAVEIFLDFFREEGGKYLRYSEYIKENAYAEEDLKAVLSDTGFEVLAVYDDMSEKLLTEDSQRAVFVCRKG